MEIRNAFHILNVSSFSRYSIRFPFHAKRKLANIFESRTSFFELPALFSPTEAAMPLLRLLFAEIRSKRNNEDVRVVTHQVSIAQNRDI